MRRLAARSDKPTSLALCFSAFVCLPSQSFEHWRSKNATPAVTAEVAVAEPTDVEKLKMLRGARQPSVTYRPPLDADESRLYSSQDALGPQSSIGSARHGTRTGGGAELESSLTIGSRQQKGLQGAAEFSMIPIDSEEEEQEGNNDEDDEDALRRSPDQEDQLIDEHSPAYGAVLPSPSAASQHHHQLSEHKHAESTHGKPCHTFVRHHSLTMHNDECECSEESTTLVTVHSIEALPTVAALNPNDPASFENASPEISLHVHSSSHTHTRNSAMEVCYESRIVASSLDPAFVVAHVSPEILAEDYWEDSEGPYTCGRRLVPRAPVITCACAVPWRSMHHLWTAHVQPESHARNITFEGHKYPAWRGQFYPVRANKAKQGEQRSLGERMHSLLRAVTDLLCCSCAVSRLCLWSLCAEWRA